MTKFEKGESTFYCPKCVATCRKQTKNKNNKNNKFKNCNKYSTDELYSVKKMSGSELITCMHTNWTNIINTLMTALDIWSYKADKHQMSMELKKCLDLRILFLIMSKIEKKANATIWEKVLMESKMETIGKDIKHMLVHQPNLAEKQFNWQLVLKDNLEKLGRNAEFKSRLVNVFLQFKKNRSPLVPKPRRTIQSQVIDRFLYSDKTQEINENEIVDLMKNLFQQNGLL